MNAPPQHTSASVRTTAAAIFSQSIGQPHRCVAAADSDWSCQDIAFNTMLSELRDWAATEKLSIAMRSAACREVSTAIMARIKTPCAQDMLTRLQTTLLRAGIDT